ncbi:IgE-dependent histamine-releasing factor, putative [Giardia duodenalis ATCC 50581]|nr:IgE-dependent histamine-releasing factor, putative [Giardia intestinalis ATCC 50581]
MLIYKDIVNGDELLSDAIITSTDDLFYIVKGKMVVADGDEDDEDAEKVIDVVFRYNLTEAEFTKKTLMSNLKKFMKAMSKSLKKTKSEEEVTAWQEKVNAWVTGLLEKFDDYNFYLGASNDVESGMVVLCKWDGADPYFYYWKDALKSEKV